MQKQNTLNEYRMYMERQKQMLRQLSSKKLAQVLGTTMNGKTIEDEEQDGNQDVQAKQKVGMGEGPVEHGDESETRADEDHSFNLNEIEHGKRSNLSKMADQ